MVPLPPFWLAWIALGATFALSSFGAEELPRCLGLAGSNAFSDNLPKRAKDWDRLCKPMGIEWVD
jgi:hypothetical protein